jgi:hypothetical protein
LWIQLCLGFFTVRKRVPQHFRRQLELRNVRSRLSGADQRVRPVRRWLVRPHLQPRLRRL